jgi:hypothetical protein
LQAPGRVGTRGRARSFKATAAAEATIIGRSLRRSALIIFGDMMKKIRNAIAAQRKLTGQ